MEVRACCLTCGQTLPPVDLETAPSVCCPCGWHSALARDAADNGVLQRCPVCGTDEMYVQKDFPERVGIALVVLAVVLSSVAWAYYSPLATFGTLFFLGGVDWILFHTRRDVTVCYRCLTQVRQMRDNPAHRAFDLAVGERFRQERLRKAEHRTAERRQEPSEHY